MFDVVPDCVEDGLNSDVLLGTDFKKRYAELLSQFLPLDLRDLSLPFLAVDLIGHDDLAYLLVVALVDLLHPIGDVVERPSISD